MRPPPEDAPAPSVEVQRVAQRLFEVARDHGSRLSDARLTDLCQQFAEQADLKSLQQADEPIEDDVEE